MNTRSINKIRRQFILIATISFFAVMLLMGTLIYTTNLLATRREMRMVLNYIVKHDGEIPRDKIDDAVAEQTVHHDSSVLTLQDIFGYGNIGSFQELLYSTHFFAVLYNENQHVKEIKTNHFGGVSESDAIYFSKRALERRRNFGVIGLYHYMVAPREEGGTIVVFLESITEIATSNRLMYTAMFLIGLGSLITLLLVRALSYQVIQPEIRNAKRQKQFITNASHELKTPLAVIRANTEVEQMINGENEWNQSTMKQVDRMTGLIQNLVMIARAEEKENPVPLLQIDISKVIVETVDTFMPVASQAGKNLTHTVPDGITLLAEESEIRQLVSLLVDNAIKYCDENGTVAVSLTGRGKVARLVVSNSYAEGKDIDYSRFFERFYRQDESHNVEKGGYGIGLSIAESLVEQYNGTISASWKDGVISFVCILRSVQSAQNAFPWKQLKKRKGK